MTRQEIDKLGAGLRRIDRRDKLTALGYVVTVFLGAPLFAVCLWVLLELASRP